MRGKHIPENNVTYIYNTWLTALPILNLLVLWKGYQAIPYHQTEEKLGQILKMFMWSTQWSIPSTNPFESFRTMHMYTPSGVYTLGMDVKSSSHWKGVGSSTWMKIWHSRYGFSIPFLGIWSVEKGYMIQMDTSRAFLSHSSHPETPRFTWTLLFVTVGAGKAHLRCGTRG